MNIDKLNQKLEEYYKNATPEQVVKDLEAMGVELENKTPPKFKAFDTLTNKFIATGFHIIGEVTIFGLIDQYISENLNGKSHLDRYNDIITLQYIDLKDQDGKEIYEGDLLSYSIDRYPQARPFYVDNVYQLHIELNRDDRYYKIDCDSLKIIGNVFEG